MLVLSRKTNEDIMIGDQVTIRLVKIGKGRARIGIDAPRGTKILRGELVARAQGETLAASKE